MMNFNECGILSAENMATVKVAIEICNSRDLKRKILCAFQNKKRTRSERNNISCMLERNLQWNETVGSTTREILENLGLPGKLREKIIGSVFSIGMRMLMWAEYHEGTFGFSRDYSIDFLNSSFFEQKGIIDNKKAAEKLMNEKNLSIRQKWKIACLYCFTDRIPILYKKISKEKKIYILGTEWPWINYLMDNVDNIEREKSLDQDGIVIAVKSGSRAAVEYCFVETRRKGFNIVDAAVTTMRERIKTEYSWSECCWLDYSPRGDWILFRDERYDTSKETWVPSDYYVDILRYLLSQMDESQQLEFLEKDIAGDVYNRKHYVDFGRSRVLEYFLDWPYQDYFMKTAEIMWEFLPFTAYATLLLRICDKIQCKKITLKYGEEKSFDYRGLLKAFWRQSPECYKRFVFSNEKVTYRSNTETYTAETGVGLLMKLLELRKFTYEDVRNIRLILDYATYKEKENILHSIEWKKMIKDEKWEILNRFALSCFSSKEDADKLKKQWCFTEEVQCYCIDLLEFDKFSAAESLLKWSSLCEKGINKFKREIIYSENGSDLCMYSILDGKMKFVDKFVRWCIPSEEEVKIFKKEFRWSNNGIYMCNKLIVEDQLEILNEFIDFSLYSEEEIRELGRNVANKHGASVCIKLITNYSEEYNEEVQGVILKFEGCNWEEVEKYLTWCFSSEEEIAEFKKGKLLKTAGKEIHFKLIELNQWGEAETLFAWLGLSPDEVKELKKETILSHREASEMFRELLHSKRGDETFCNYGHKQESIELLLRWYLTDKEAALEFKNQFKSGYLDVTEENEVFLKDFDLMIEQRLTDLDKEQMAIKK